jgi:hypothetical protein
MHCPRIHQHLTYKGDVDPGVTLCQRARCNASAVAQACLHMDHLRPRGVRMADCSWPQQGGFSSAACCSYRGQLGGQRGAQPPLYTSLDHGGTPLEDTLGCAGGLGLPEPQSPSTKKTEPRAVFRLAFGCELCSDFIC